MYRHNRHIAEELYELISSFPWWAALLSALATYAVLHPLAILQMPTPVGVVDVATTALAQLLVMLARIGQYVIPIGLLLATAVSAFSRWKRHDLRSSAANDATGTLLRGLPQADFELLVVEAFRDQGYRTSPTREDQLTKAADLEVTRDEKRYLVQYRNWKASFLDFGVVRELNAAVKAVDAAGGFVVTSGRFTPEARHFGLDAGIELIDGRRLKELFQSSQWPVSSARDRGWENVLSALDWLKNLAHSGKNRWGARAPSATASHTPHDLLATKHFVRTEPLLTDSGDVQDSMEQAIGQELTALLRSDESISDRAGNLRVPPTPPRFEQGGQYTHRILRPRFSKVVDIVGILLTLSGIWVGYQWFQSLPEQPTTSPWSLLGSGLVDASSGLIPAPSRQADEGRVKQRPLGQFDFGGNWEQKKAAVEVPPELEKEPVVEYHSLRELEAAFSRKYIPPSDCYAWETNAEMVRCGNHRMRARRAFIDSGGKVTPETIGTTETLGSYPQPPAHAPAPDWRLEQEQQPEVVPERFWGQTWQQNPASEGTLEQESGVEWERSTTPVQEQQWSRDLRQGLPQDEVQGWRTEQDQLPPQAWRSGTDWRQVQDEQQDWQRGPAPEVDWHEPQDWRRKEYSRPTGGWLQQQDRFQDQALDWRRERLEDPQ